MTKVRLQILTKNYDKTRKAEGNSCTKVGIKRHIRSPLKFVAFYNSRLFEVCGVLFNSAVFSILRKNNCGKICDVSIFTVKFVEF